MSHAPDGRRRALVVFESMLGTTEAVAHPLLWGELARAEIWVTTAVADLAPRPGRQHEPAPAAR